MSAVSSDGSTSVALKQLDAQLLRLSEGQKKRAKRTETSDENSTFWLATFTIAPSFSSCSCPCRSSGRCGSPTPRRMRSCLWRSVPDFPWFWWVLPA